MAFFPPPGRLCFRECAQFVNRGEQREEFNLKRNGIPAGEHSLSLCVSLPPRQTPPLAAEAPTWGTHSLGAEVDLQWELVQPHPSLGGLVVFGAKTPSQIFEIRHKSSGGATTPTSHLDFKSRYVEL